MARWRLRALVWLAASAAVGGDLRRFEREQVHMATTIRLTFYAAGEAAASTAADAAFARIATLNKRLSDYDPASELSRLSANAGRGPQPVGPELFACLERAAHWRRASAGAFDIALAPSIKLWRQARKTKRMPRPEEVAAALERTKGERVTLDPEKRTATLAPGTLLDLGGIAKGYAGDEMLKVLAAQGVPRALVAVGGDVVAGAPPPGQTGWRVTLHAWENHPELRGTTLLLADAAASTSGDTAQFATIGGQRFGHIVDPRTGRPVEQRRQATAVCRRGIDADALATVAYLAGPEGFAALADNTEGAAVLFASMDDAGKLQVKPSARWPALPKEAPAGK